MILGWRCGAAAVVLLAVGGCACGKAHAATAATNSDPVTLGQFSGWTAFTYKAPDTKVCYISAQPKTSQPKTGKRDPAFFLITNFPGRKVRGEISFMAGYAYKKGSTVDLTVDNKPFKLFTNADGAWADSPDTEKKIVDALKSGQSLIVKGTSWRNTQTIDTFALDGITAGLAKINDACN